MVGSFNFTNVGTVKISIEGNERERHTVNICRLFKIQKCIAKFQASDVTQPNAGAW